MPDFNPLAPASDRENYAPREEGSEPVQAPPARPVVPESGYEIVTPQHALVDGQAVRVWRGSRWRGATIRGEVRGSIASVIFLGGGSGTPHISRIAVRTAKPVADVTHPLLLAAVAERNRQVSRGWNTEYDDGCVKGEIPDAAAAYAVSKPQEGHALWPWHPHEFLRTENGDRRQDLVKAVALLMAEWDRDARERAR